jgi:hypothetical protein
VEDLAPGLDREPEAFPPALDRLDGVEEPVDHLGWAERLALRPGLDRLGEATQRGSETAS